VVADEHDVIRVRTTYRQPQEDVYVYRVRAPLENIRRGFLDYMKTINEMREWPRFYNTLATNCTTTIAAHTRVNPEAPPWSWKILLSGYLPDYLYELGRLDATRPFAELSGSRGSMRALTPRITIPYSRNASVRDCRCRRRCRESAIV